MNQSSGRRRVIAVRQRIVLALLPLAAGCSTLLPTSYRYGWVEASVTDSGGAPVAGVDLLLYVGVRHMAVGSTDAGGRYRFENVPAGDYGVYLMRAPDGYSLPAGDIGHRYVHMEEGTRDSVSFVLRPPGGTP